MVFTPVSLATCSKEYGQSAHLEQDIEMCSPIPGGTCSRWLLAIGAGIQNGLRTATCPKHSHFHIKDAYMQNEEASHMNITLEVYTNLICSCSV